jgi:hypothetical protein
MNVQSSLKVQHILLLVILLVVGLSVGSRVVTAVSPQTITGQHTIFLPIILKDGSLGGSDDEFILTALSDANIVAPMGAGMDVFLQAQKILVCDMFQPVVTHPVTYAQAQTNIWNYLNAQVGAANIATFRTLPEAATADTAQAFAVAAIADRRPDGALTSLMVAAEKAPNNPMILISTAGVLNNMDMPNEALALLDRAQTLPGELASPLNISGEQMAANNRGHALMVLGRWAEAETVLRPIVEAESELAEARTNLSIALLCQDKNDEAGHAYRLGARRNLYDLVETGGHLPLDRIYDRSAGQTLSLPGIPIAPTAEQTESMAVRYSEMMSSHMTRYTQMTHQIDTLTDEIRQRQPSLPLLTSLRYANVIGAITTVNQEPYIQQLGEAVTEAEAAVDELYAEHFTELNDLFEEGLPAEELYPACQQLLMGQWGSKKLALLAYDDSRRDHAAALYYEQTGLAANLADPLHHEVASLMAKQNAVAAFGDIVGSYSVANTETAALWLTCEGPPLDGGTEGEDPTFDEAEKCPPLVRGVKLGVKIAGLTINVNCEIIEMEASASAAMGLFGQVTVDFRQDTMTAFVGAKAKVGIGPVELSAKEGIYVRANRGGLTDVGMKVSTTGSITNGRIAGKIDGPGFEFSVVSAMGYIFSGN